MEKNVIIAEEPVTMRESAHRREEARETTREPKVTGKAKVQRATSKEQKESGKARAKESSKARAAREIQKEKGQVEGHNMEVAGFAEAHTSAENVLTPTEVETGR